MNGRLRARPSPAPDDYFWTKVDKNGPDGCWLWRGNIDPSTGYGRIGRLGTNFKAHRITYVATHGEHDPDLVIDHLCRVRHCVNPSHMEVVTAGENALRGEGVSAYNILVERCPAGHDYTPANTYNSPSGSRVCRTCKNAWRKAEKERARERKRLGVGPGKPGRPRNSNAALAALTKVGG